MLSNLRGEGGGGGGGSKSARKYYGHPGTLGTRLRAPNPFLRALSLSFKHLLRMLNAEKYKVGNKDVGYERLN